MVPQTTPPPSTAQSAQLSERLRRVLPAGDTRAATYYRPYPLALARGAGCEVWDVDGNRLIDLLNNFTSLVHGHSHPAITEAISAQLELGTVFPAPNALQAELAERICARLDSAELVRFTNSGTEAVIQAVRAARAHTGRVEIVKAIGGYHGSWEQVPTTFETGAGGESREAALSAVGVPAFVQGVVHMVPYNDTEALEQVMRERGERVAALIFEPVLGHGVIAGDPEFFTAARRLADEHGALLILDEVVTARLAWGGYQSVLAVRADLTTLGKIIGGGLPVGAVAGREDVMRRFAPDRLEVIPHSGTYNGNPLTMAAGCVSLDLLTESQIGRINGLASMLAAALGRVLAEHAWPGYVNVCGSLLNLQIDTAAATELAGDPGRAAEFLPRLHLAALDQGLYFASRGALNLSTAMDEQRVGEVVDAFERAVAASPGA